MFACCARVVRGVFNLEMAATDDMLAIALDVRPDFCTLVPEKRSERTTEGGLEVRAGGLARARGRGAAGRGHRRQPVHRSGRRRGGSGASVGRQHRRTAHRLLLRRRAAIARIPSASFRVCRRRPGPRPIGDCGWGRATVWTTPTSGRWPALPHLEELNIGHGLVARAVMVGLDRAVCELRAAIQEGAASAQGGR